MKWRIALAGLVVVGIVVGFRCAEQRKASPASPPKAETPTAASSPAAPTTGSPAPATATPGNSPPAPPTAGPSAPSSATVPGPAAASPAEDLFQTKIRPILTAKCAPCHNPGGKVYGKLPFDDPQVVVSHREGVLRRLKVEEDRELFLRWAEGGKTP